MLLSTFQAVFSIVAAVLHLGNLQFEESNDGPAVLADEAPVEILSQVKHNDTNNIWSLLLSSIHMIFFINFLKFYKLLNLIKHIEFVKR